MLQRLLLVFSLIFLFGLGQQGALTHAIGHLSDVQQHDQPQQDKSHHSPACDKCVVYAELGNTVSSTVFLLPSLPQTFRLVATPAIHAGSVSRQPYSARAPPVLA